MSYSIDLELESGERSLSVRRFTAVERMSGPFEVVVLALSQHADLDIDDIVGRGAGIAVRGTSRAWTGICRRVGQVAVETSDKGQSTYLLHIVPTLWLLGQRRGHRIFQDKSIPEIAEKLFEEWDIEHEVRIDRDAYPKLEYCVQYAETDLAFLSRLLERAGISYTFIAVPDGDKLRSRLVLSDRPDGNEMWGILRYVDNPSQEGRSEFVTEVTLAHQMTPTRFTLRDHDLRKPDHPLFGPPEGKTSAAGGGDEEARYEHYVYMPGGALIEVDEADVRTPAADDRSKARHDEGHAAARAAVAQRALRVGREYVRLRTSVLDLAPGVVFRIDRHGHEELGVGQPLLVVGARTEGDALGSWTMLAEAVFADPADPYRPPQVTPRPRVHGLQSAIVVGPDEQEIYTDEFGRARVRFHWDREGKFDEESTCWLRVSQPWSGPQYGMQLLPRVGSEVLVDFLDGDPDQPVIVGRLHNVTTPHPYVLPKAKTQSTWKSESSPRPEGWFSTTAGEAFNEIMFDDAAGQELVFVQAERELQKLVKRDEAERTGNDRKLIVGKAQRSIVAAEDVRQVGGQRLIQIVDVDELNIEKMGDPEFEPKPTSLEVKDEKITLTTGEATIVLEGPTITVETEDWIGLTAKGRVIIQGGPNVYLNEEPGSHVRPDAQGAIRDGVRKPVHDVLPAIEGLFADVEEPGEIDHEFEGVTIRHAGAPEPDAECAALWEKYEQETEAMLAPAEGDVRKRNDIISGAYADMHLGNPSFAWAGLAAYASKQVGCAMDHALVPEGTLGEGNVSLFRDIYPVHRFYEEQGYERLQRCARDRDVPRDVVNAFNEAYIAEATKDPGHLQKHVQGLAYHEQVRVLQGIVYDSTFMNAAMNAANLTGIFPLELVLGPGCDGEPASRFPRLGDIADLQDRMEWINGPISEKYFEVLDTPGVHGGNLEIIRQRGIAAGGEYPP